MKTDQVDSSSKIVNYTKLTNRQLLDIYVFSNDDEIKRQVSKLLGSYPVDIK